MVVLNQYFLTTLEFVEFVLCQFGRLALIIVNFVEQFDCSLSHSVKTI